MGGQYTGAYLHKRLRLREAYHLRWRDVNGDGLVWTSTVSDDVECDVNVDEIALIEDEGITLDDAPGLGLSAEVDSLVEDPALRNTLRFGVKVRRTSRQDVGFVAMAVDLSYSVSICEHTQ